MMIHDVDVSGVKIDFWLVRQVRTANENESAKFSGVKIGFWLVRQRSV